VNLKKKAARTFTELPGGLMSIKTFGHGGRLVNERIVPVEEGRQIQQGYRPREQRATAPYRKVD
jgi:hypothetical protein